MKIYAVIANVCDWDDPYTQEKRCLGIFDSKEKADEIAKEKVDELTTSYRASVKSDLTTLESYRATQIDLGEWDFESDEPEYQYTLKDYREMLKSDCSEDVSVFEMELNSKIDILIGCYGE